MGTLHVCFLFHMHQPDYRHPTTGQPEMPWVRLHGIRSYTDIPWLMEQRPDAAFTLNLVPSLLSQLEQLESGSATDPWLARSRMRPEDMSEEDRWFVIEHFFAVNVTRHLPPGSRYRELYDKRSSHKRKDWLAVFSHTDIRDLQVCFQLAWFGFAARDMFPELSDLAGKGRDYSDDDRRTLLALQDQVLAGVRPRLRRLAAQSIGELCISPATHPILPLLVDTDAARRAAPDLTLPPRIQAPEEATAQITKGIEAFRSELGRDPAGMWPSEGSVSPEVLSLMAEAGLTWFATDEEVGLRTGLASHPVDVWSRPWRFQTDAGPIIGIFRNRNLSDRIGFEYHHTDTDTAVNQFMRELDSIRKATSHRREDILVPIILDGENPWEHYPDSGRPFLEQLLHRLAAEPDIQMDPLSRAIQAIPPADATEPIHSGSWIHAAFRIWIGHPETNLAWTRLGRAIRTVRAAEEKKADPSRLAVARKHLRAAEGSDWFWWYGDDFKSDYKDRFDRLFHAHLSAVYQALDLPVPDALSEPIHPHRTGSPVVQPVALIHPPMNGRDRIIDWRGSGIYQPRSLGGAMHAGTPPVTAIRFGWNPDTLFVRIEPAPGTLWSSMTLQVLDGTPMRIRLGPSTGPVKVEQAATGHWTDSDIQVTVTGDRHRTIALPLQASHRPPGEAIRLALEIVRTDGRRFRLPDTGAIHIGLTWPVDAAAWWWVE